MAEYIDRDKALADLKESADHHAQDSRECQLLLRDRNILREQATADVAPVIHSGWIVQIDCEGKTRKCKCKRCGYTTGPFTWDNPNFCSRCGAKMDGAEECNKLVFEGE